MKAFVDKDLCIGCELCTEICPDVFSMSDEGYAVAIEDDIDEYIETAEDARDQCPTEAISIDE